jgi:hypothetical protein
LARIIIVTATPVYRKGQVLELCASEATALGAARATVYRDALGEGSAASNSSA